jgi:hypothetical protein
VPEWLKLSVFLSVLTVGEIHRGIVGIRKKDLHQAHHLEAWHDFLPKLTWSSESTRGRGRDVLAKAGAQWRHLACLRKHIIQTISCNDHSGTVSFALQAGISLK